MKKLRIGVIGLGDISHVYLTNLKKYSDYVTIEACASRSLEKAQRKADQYGIPHAYANAEELIREADIDLILNLTTPDMHYILNKLALECGRHVYTEKPLAFTYAQGKELLELSASKQLRIGCAPDTFLGARLQTCRDILDSGKIGDVIGASAFVIYHGLETFHPNPAFYYHEGAGPLMDIGPYYVNALLSLLGPVQSCCAMSKRTFDQRLITTEPHKGEMIDVEVDTYTTGLMQFASGAIGTAIFHLMCGIPTCRALKFMAQRVRSASQILTRWMGRISLAAISCCVQRKITAGISSHATGMMSSRIGYMSQSLVHLHRLAIRRIAVALVW